MALTWSSDEESLSASDRERLLGIARGSIEHGLRGERLAVRAEDHPPAFRLPRATFVTLHIERELRGCIGTLDARRPLVVDVVANAYAAAFDDPRFPALRIGELAHLVLHISILSPPEPLRFASEADLLRQLRPGIDGLVLAEGRQRGTFLPAVWEALPEPREFLRNLKHKAGLPADYWSGTIEVARYTTESIP